MTKTGKAITFITGAGLHKSIYDRIGAADWEWNAAKEAEEDGYSKYISSQIKQVLGGLGSFSLKRYFKEARNRLFDSKFIPDGMSLISANDERKRVISRIHRSLQNHLKNKHILSLVAEDYIRILKLESRHFRWFLKVVQWMWSEQNDEERLFSKFRGFKITQNARLSDYYDLQIENLADALLLFHTIIRDVLSKTKPKETSPNIKVILKPEEAKRTQDLNSELYILLFDLLLGFYATVNMIAIIRGETAISKTVKNILGKLNFSFRYISNIEEVITDELGEISKTIFYNSEVLKILSTSPSFLNLQKHLSQWYSGFFTGEMSDVKKYIYTSRMLTHYLRKTSKNAENSIRRSLQEANQSNQSNQDNIINIIRKYANHIITTNYIPIESMILFDDPNQAYENTEGDSLPCVQSVVYVHGHLWEEIIAAAHYTPQQLRRGKFLDFRFEHFYSPIYSEKIYKENALMEETLEKTLEKEEDYQNPPWGKKKIQSQIKRANPNHNQLLQHLVQPQSSPFFNSCHCPTSGIQNHADRSFCPKIQDSNTAYI